MSFWSHPYGVLVDASDPGASLVQLIQCANYAGKAGWDWQEWSDPIFHFRFADFDEAVFFCLINNGELY